MVSNSNGMKLIFFIFTLVMISGCSPDISEVREFKVGTVYKVLGDHHYQIISTGKANQQAIENEDEFKKKFSACQAAKEMYLKQLKELEPEQSRREFLIESRSQRVSEDNLYCEITIVYNQSIAEKK